MFFRGLYKRAVNLNYNICLRQERNSLLRGKPTHSTLFTARMASSGAGKGGAFQTVKEKQAQEQPG